ncbi:MAG: isoaspartyl peptidase/L-asparaginase [Myxococcaceae bacterium]|nr:isoaspartyl peptidase/L-asparaginase [Myxococcaceae bacterium]
MILVHGGAGEVGPLDNREQAINGVKIAARVGQRVLNEGGTALDAVVAAVVALENDPIFNAGLGSTLTREGEVEMDAALMNGRNLAAGAVANVKDIQNPILLARLVMERTPHVLLVGEGAHAFAREQQVTFVEPGGLVTPRVRAKWEKALSEDTLGVEGGTVGAVAVDRKGHVAAATSTGGTLLKRSGRVGDSPLIGAGTFADDLGAAVSCTGHGESMMKTVLAKYASDRVRGGAAPDVAARAAIEELWRVGGRGGVILADAKGRLGFAFNTARLARAWVDAEGHEGAGYE